KHRQIRQVLLPDLHDTKVGRSGGGFSDSCHSGEIFREFPAEVIPITWRSAIFLLFYGDAAALRSFSSQTKS
ncbi:MAG: hypothetical protein KDC30_02035, partial [Saprospiraceae bacterium]|nr:hypothetical protein [Saprospiraceae bacterium]